MGKIRFGDLTIDDTAPAPAAGDSLIIKKNGGGLREATFDELGLTPVVTSVIDLPTTDGSADQAVVTDGADTLSFANRVVVREYTFTENAGAAGQTYTASCSVPAGAWLLDVIVAGVALWDDTGAVSLTAGTSTPNDPDGFFTATNLKATDLLAGEYLSAFDDGAWGGVNGAYLTTAGVRYHYLATARTVTCTVTTANGDGTAGRTRFLVVYAVPTTTTAATQAAT